MSDKKMLKNLLIVIVIINIFSLAITNLLGHKNNTTISLDSPFAPQNCCNLSGMRADTYRKPFKNKEYMCASKYIYLTNRDYNSNDSMNYIASGGEDKANELSIMLYVIDTNEAQYSRERFA